MKHTLIALTSILALGLAACSERPTPGPAALPEVTYTATEFAFAGPTSLQAGLNAITLVNEGHEPHLLELARLHDGVTLAAFKDALDSGDFGAAMGMVDLAGGVDELEHGGRGRYVVDLKPGTYVLFCPIGGEDEPPHFDQGMIQTIQVLPRTGEPPADPASQVQVTGSEYAFSVTGTATAGKHTWAFRNDGNEPHELGLARLHDGKTQADLMAWLESGEGEPPADLLEGALPIAGGGRVFVDLDLTAGRYVAFCMIPAPDGKSHVDHGMVRAFSIQP